MYNEFDVEQILFTGQASWLAVEWTDIKVFLFTFNASTTWGRYFKYLNFIKSFRSSWYRRNYISILSSLLFVGNGNLHLNLNDCERRNYNQDYLLFMGIFVNYLMTNVLDENSHIHVRHKLFGKLHIYRVIVICNYEKTIFSVWI